MTVEMSWDHSISPGGSVLVVHYIGEWTWQEFVTARTAKLNSFPQPERAWAIIHDMHQQKHMPLDALPHAVELVVREADPLVKMQIMVGISPLLVRLYGMFVQMLPVSMRSQFSIAGSLEIAHEYVCQALSESAA